MNKYKFLYLFWLLPGYFLFLTLHQTAVYFSMKSTYQNGQGYIAEVVDFEIEQIAAQTNGNVTIQFTTDENETVQKTIALSAEVTARVSQSQMVPIRYKKEAFTEVVFISTFEIQKGFTLTNIAMGAVAFIITFFVGLLAHRKARKLSKDGKKELVVERMDTNVL